MRPAKKRRLARPVHLNTRLKQRTPPGGLARALTGAPRTHISLATGRSGVTVPSSIENGIIQFPGPMTAASE